MISRKITLRALLQHLRRLSQERIPPIQEQTCLPRTMLGSLRWIDFFCKVLCQTRAPCLQAFRPIKAFAQLYSRGCVVFGDPPLLLSAFFNSMQRPKGNSPTGSGRNSFGVPASPPLSVLQDCAAVRVSNFGGRGFSNARRERTAPFVFQRSVLL